MRGCRFLQPPVLACTLAACANLAGIEERRYVEPSSSSGSSGDASSGATTSVAASTTQSSTSGDGGSGGTGQGGAASGGGGGGGCDANLDGDASNCGACGHDCLGGTCDGGICQPYEVVAAMPGAEYRSLRVDPGPGGALAFARWRPNAAVFRADKTPGSNPVTVAQLEASGWANDVALDADWIYFTNYSDHDHDEVRGVYAVRRSGGAPVQLARDDAALRLLGTAFLRVDGPDVFFATFFGSIAVGRTAHGGVPVLPIWAIDAPPPIYDLGGYPALDDEWVYLPSQSAGLPRHRRAGPDPEVLYPSVTNANLFAVREGLVY